ncbi:hypothetical protein HY486_04755 [Candidatus Woesearchaeota archaeon]|nr:hypothetical protein [Candidatus Woesearchaeota archaeon]
MYDLVKTKEELETLAELMQKEVLGRKETVARYTRIVYISSTFLNGTRSEVNACQSDFNLERMTEGIYTVTGVDDLMPHNIEEVRVARDLQQHRFSFCRKKIPLPTEKATIFFTLPLNITHYDQELSAFTKSHKNTRITRALTIEQRIIVNSNGGKVIQSIPFFQIQYTHGYPPIQTNRDIKVVCATNDDIKRLPALIEYIADPTPDKKIKKARTFSEAFSELHQISGLKYGSMEEAGIPTAELYDVIMLTGVPAHEIFGHHFEEPIRYLSFGESGTFKKGQNIKNTGLILTDNPAQKIAGFNVSGFTLYDAYGRRRTQRTHIQDGQVIAFLGSEYADEAEKLGKYNNTQPEHFTGNASQYVDGYFPQPRMSCTVLTGKTEQVCTEGKLILVSSEGHTDPRDKTYLVRAEECYIIKNGVPKRVIPLQVTGGINQALANIKLLDDESYQTGMCGKPEPIYYPNSIGRASVPVSQLAKSQMWQAQQVYPLPISDAHLKVLMRPN